ncbi:MAG: ribose transporter permease, partial [Armatimonadetes bacterium]|nr:ribose transporter permease [Armatimonadota bacterium]
MTEHTKPSPAARAVLQAAGVLRPWLILAVVCAGFSLHPGFRQTFWTADYLPNILQQAGTNIILAVGLTFVILTGGIDLSVGSVLALCGVTLGLALTGHPPPFIRVGMLLPVGAVAGALIGGVVLRNGASSRMGGAAAGAATVVATAALVLLLPPAPVGLGLGLLAALGMGFTCGLINGLVVSIGRVPPFVVTLGMYTAARGLTVYATDGNSVSGLPPTLGALGQGWPLVAISLVVVIGGIVLHTLTRAGRMIVSVGANEEATRLSGVSVTTYKLLAYLLSGITAAIAAIVLTAKFQLADTGAGTGAELNAIAAVVIGGTSLSGGRGTVLGSLVGALTIAVLNAGM